MERDRVIERIGEGFAALSLSDRLARIRGAIEGRIVFTTSFGLEDQVITHEIFLHDLAIDVVTLDTGRLFPETHALWAGTEARYGRRIAGYHPHHDALREFVAARGINSFYQSIENRKACCHVRKVEPLARALAGASAWITGLRAEQTEARAHSDFLEFETARGLIKANPLLDWSRDVLASYVADRDIPHSPLHAKGYLSIGCQPCTRAVRPGERERAGRWWWEKEGAKECGLHVDAGGMLVRGAA